MAYRCFVIDVAASGDLHVIRHHGLFSQKGGRYVGDVFTAVAIFRKAGIVGGDAFATG